MECWPPKNASQLFSKVWSIGLKLKSGRVFFLDLLSLTRFDDDDDDDNDDDDYDGDDDDDDDNDDDNLCLS